MEPVKKDRIIVEYTGNRVKEDALVRMKRSFDLHGINLDVQADVPSEEAMIDPRGCGNQAIKINHSCKPNARLQEIGVGRKKIV